MTRREGTNLLALSDWQPKEVLRAIALGPKLYRRAVGRARTFEATNEQISIRLYPTAPHRIQATLSMGGDRQKFALTLEKVEFIGSAWDGLAGLIPALMLASQRGSDEIRLSGELGLLQWLLEIDRFVLADTTELVTDELRHAVAYLRAASGWTDPWMIDWGDSLRITVLRDYPAYYIPRSIWDGPDCDLPYPLEALERTVVLDSWSGRWINVHISPGHLLFEQPAQPLEGLQHMLALATLEKRLGSADYADELFQFGQHLKAI